MVDRDQEENNMNSAVSTESMDIGDEQVHRKSKDYDWEMSQVEGISGGSDDEDECVSSPAGSAYGDEEMRKSAMSDEVTKTLAAAGPVGMAAAAAIASSKKRKRPHAFETNPSVRKRHQNRLLRKLRQTIEEFATRVGQQAVVLIASPGKPNASYRVFGAKPLEDVVRNLRSMIVEELENALQQQFGLGAHGQAPPPPPEDPSLFELPPLIIDGIPTPVEKMTQAQLRAFIPLMLKYSMVRGKPGWGRDSTRPPWWPKDLPWANVRMDARTEDEKQKMSWTHALRQIVVNCYKYHGREDLLPAFNEDDDKPNSSNMQYAPAVLHSITNPDGSVSILNLDPNNPIITLPDGTTAQVVSIHTGDVGAGSVVQTLDADGNALALDINAVEALADNQIIITGEDGDLYDVAGRPLSQVVTLPMYQQMVAQMANGDGVCVTPLVQVDQNGDTIETISMGGGVAQMMMSSDTQVLQVLSLKDATVLTKAMNVKAEREAVVTDS